MEIRDTVEACPTGCFKQGGDHTLMMAGWITRACRYCKGLYGYWRNTILTVLGAVFLIAGFLILYPLFQDVPPALRYLLMVVLPLSFVLLAMFTWSLLPDSFLMELGGGYPYGSIQWLDPRKIFGKYRKYVLIGAAGNLVFFSGLGVYLVSPAGEGEGILASETAGVMILLSWIILNCGLVIASYTIIRLKPDSRFD